jgi:2-polyprenyl-6-methoxyphenol hydroxylase-like FAD-dependent oxidoreductase
MASAVVLGGGLAGMLAATAVARHVDQVTIIESDRLPDSPRPRRGLPQGYHNHTLLSGGARALDSLLPGTTDLLYAAGAKQRLMSAGMAMMTAEGYYMRHQCTAYMLACSRDLIDHVVRQRVLRDDAVRLLESTEVLGLAGDAGRVHGVRIKEDDQPERVLAADLVIDATGRRSKTPQWLVELGLPQVKEEVLDAGFAYSSRLFEAPPEAPAEFPGILMQAEGNTGRPGRGGALLPNEDGRWIVALIGTRGGHPPTDENGFMEFARSLPHPVFAQLMETASPLGPIRAYRGIANQRRRYDRMRLPENFLVIGDAAQALNPNYATGMSVSALGAVVLRTQLKRQGLTPGLGRKVQAGITKAGLGPWQNATATDQWFPRVETNFKPVGGAMMRRFSARVSRTAAVDAAVCNAVVNVGCLDAPPTAMMTLPVLRTVLRKPRRDQLTADEAIAQFPEFAELLAAVAADPAPAS